MARGTSFLTLLDMLRDEIGQSTNVGLGIDNLSTMKRHVNRGYSLCWDAFDWPHLRIVEPRITLNAGQRLYDFPSSIGYERTESLTAYIDQQPYPLERGIDHRQYAIFDSENDIRSDPALKWDIRWSGTAPQIEIWPIPSSSEQELEIIGIKKLARLVNDEDLCLLDDEMVVLAASIRPLKRQDSKDGDAAAAEFSSRIAQMKARTGPSKRITMGGAGNNQNNSRTTVTIVGR